MRFATFTFLFLVSFSYWAFPQGKIDSLRTEAEQSKQQLKPEIYNNIARLYWYRSFDSSIFYANKAYNLAEKYKLPVEMAKALNNLGVAYDMRGEYGKSLNHYFKAINLAINQGAFTPDIPIDFFLSNKNSSAFSNTKPISDSLGVKSNAALKEPNTETKALLAVVANSYVNVAIVYGKLSRFEKSLVCLRQSLYIRESLGDKRGVGVVLINLGTVYSKLKNFKMAENAYRESLKIRTEFSDQQGIANCNLGLGELFKESGNIDSAFIYLRKAEQIFKKIDSKKGISQVRAKIGDLYGATNQPVIAIAELQTALELMLELKDKEGISSVNLRIGEVYLLAGKHKKAQTHYQKALALAREMEYYDIAAQALQGLSLVYERQGKTREAYSLLKEYVSSYKSLKENEFSGLLAEQLSLFEFDQIERENTLLKKEGEIRQLNQSRQNIIYILLITIISIVLLLGMIILFMYRSILRTNKQLTLLNSDLESKVGTRTMELREALKLAEEANRLKSAFLSNISHEIRTPLNAIMGFTSLMASEMSKESMGARFIAEIRHSSDRLMNLINNIIDISRSEASEIRLNLKKCNIQSIAEQAVANFTEEFNVSGIKLITNFDRVPNVYADYDNLHRVCSIVLSNALKYTEKGSVAVTTVFRVKSETVELIFSDTGVGIDSEYLPFIFEPFLQESTGLSRLYQGAGLGLALAKRLLSAMGGTISVTSRKGAGTIVCISFKIAQIDGNGDAPKIRNTKRDPERGTYPRAKKAKVLIVEENTYARFYLQSLLKRYLNVFVARDGNEALSLIDDSITFGPLFDMVIVDATLPEPWSTHLFITEVYNRKAEYRKRPFIVQFEEVNPPQTTNHLDMGYAELIEKPIDKKKIYQLLAQHGRFKKG
jgi:signal transduction histidine kinase